MDKKEPRSPLAKQANQATPPVAFSLRISPPLRIAADNYANATGVSLNSLVCIALADYLAARGHLVKV